MRINSIKEALGILAGAIMIDEWSAMSAHVDRSLHEGTFVEVTICSTSDKEETAIFMMVFGFVDRIRHFHEILENDYHMVYGLCRCEQQIFGYPLSEIVSSILINAVKEGVIEKQTMIDFIVTLDKPELIAEFAVETGDEQIKESRFDL